MPDAFHQYPRSTIKAIKPARGELACLSSTCRGRARSPDRILKSKKLDDSVIRRVARRASVSIDLMGDIHASEEYRVRPTIVYAKRAVNEAVSRIT